MTEMALPVAARELVANEPILSLGIGHAQQRLGETHQHDALVARKRVFLSEGVDAARLRAQRAHPRNQVAGERRRGDAFGRRHFGLGDQGFQDLILVGEIGFRNRLTQKVHLGGSVFSQVTIAQGRRPALS